jgi:hypothetical protein
VNAQVEGQLEGKKGILLPESNNSTWLPVAGNRDKKRINEREEVKLEKEEYHIYI